MTTKYQRPGGAYAGDTALANRGKYQDDANAVPKRPISSAKVDGDFNYLVDALNRIDEASGACAGIAERLEVALNPDGTLKFSTTGALDEWIIHTNPGALVRVDNSTFTLGGGDFRPLYKVGRRARVTVGGAGLVGDVASCTFAGGITTVSLVDIVDANGMLAVIASAPTQVAYSPVTGGVRGNSPRRFDSLTVPVSGADCVLGADGADLAIKRSGTVVARVGANGVSGLSPASVAVATLDATVVQKLVPTGALMPFAGGSAPGGWLLCAGQAISRATYADLFAVLGVVYGSGDGSTTFNLPDLRGRAVFGLDNMNGSAANRVTSAVSGINGAVLGTGGGSEALHAHSHGVTDPGHTHTYNAAASRNSNASSGGFAQANDVPASLTSPATTGITVNSAGAGNSQNMPPALMLNYIIKA